MNKILFGKTRRLTAVLLATLLLGLAACQEVKLPPMPSWLDTHSSALSTATPSPTGTTTLVLKPGENCAIGYIRLENDEGKLLVKMLGQDPIEYDHGTSWYIFGELKLTTSEDKGWTIEHPARLEVKCASEPTKGG